MRVLVCGGRNFRDFDLLSRTLVQVSPSVIIDGGARGADWMASSWALENRVRSITYRADWNAHGKAAGPIRNQRMLDEGRPDLVLAFPGGRGTDDIVRRANAAGIKVARISADQSPRLKSFDDIREERR